MGSSNQTVLEYIRIMTVFGLTGNPSNVKPAILPGWITPSLLLVNASSMLDLTRLLLCAFAHLWVRRAYFFGGESYRFLMALWGGTKRFQIRMHHVRFYL
jgi:hypothetical protein